MAQYSTDFSEYTTGAAPSDWTARWGAGTVFEVRAGGDIGSKHLFIDAGTGSAYTWDDIDADANRDVVDVLMAFKLASVATSTNPRCGALVLANDDRDGYFCGVSQDTTQRMRRVVNNTEVSLGTDTSITFATATLYWLRMQRLSDNTVRTRMWVDGGSEPGTWQISVSDSNVTAAGAVGIYSTSTASEPEIHYFAVGTNGDSAPTPGAGGAATAVTLTGPTSGTTGVASSNFTVGADGTITGDVVVTPSDGGDGGTFTPTTVTINSGSPTGTFTYTPASTGTKTISVTNDGGLTNPSSISYTSNAAADPPVITGQPSNATVKRGQTATFTVTATGSGTVTYQWQRNPGGVGSWADISGATSASYTTPATTISGGSANDQDDYRCQVSDDDAGPVATDVVTLTVQQATLALNAAGYEIADGNSPATAAIDASVAWEIEVINDALPPVSVYHSDSVTTSAAGRLADISDDDLIFGTTYTVLGRRVSDGEWFAFTITAT